nr:unknown [Zea mays]
MRDFLRGSRISDTHLPQLRRRTPRYDGCLYPLRLSTPRRWRWRPPPPRPFRRHSPTPRCPPCCSSCCSPRLAGHYCYWRCRCCWLLLLGSPAKTPSSACSCLWTSCREPLAAPH